MLRPKKNSYKEFDNEKNSCGSKIPLPPITFLMVRPLYGNGFFELSRMLKRKNVNNDVSKDSPILYGTQH